MGAISGFGDTRRNSWAVQELQVRAERPPAPAATCAGQAQVTRGFQSSNLPRVCLQIKSSISENGGRS